MYPWTALVFAFSALAAFGGFIWAWLVHVLHAGENSHSGEYFWRNFILRLAVVLAAAVPVVNAPFLANPDWEGTLSQYITLGTLTGAAAIALTPTFRVLALPPRLGRTASAAAAGRAPGQARGPAPGTSSRAGPSHRPGRGRQDDRDRRRPGPRRSGNQLAAGPAPGRAEQAAGRPTVRGPAPAERVTLSGPRPCLE